jgi:hypothetical protein
LNLRIAAAVALALTAACYGETFRIWFRADDFAWLGLSASDNLLEVFFKPAAQGTVRVLSERLFFFGFGRMFGLESAIPFRVLILLTLAANAFLLAVIAHRLTASRLSAWTAMAVWILHPGVSMAVCWISSYNQLLVTFCMLAAVLAFLMDRKLWCWVAFFAGFGALETNVMLPALLVAVQPKRWRETLPFFAVSSAYSILWWTCIRIPDANPAYRMHFDLSAISTLWQYVHLNFGHDASTVYLLAFLPLAVEWKRCRTGIVWFVLLLLPVLPLRDHVSDYYLASASIGLALAVALLHDRPAWQLMLACVLLASGLQSRERAITWYRDVTAQIETVVRGVRELHRENPGKTIALENIPQDVVDNALGDDPFRLYGIRIGSGADAVVYRYASPSSSR